MEEEESLEGIISIDESLITSRLSQILDDVLDDRSSSHSVEKLKDVAVKYVCLKRYCDLSN